MEGTQVVLFPSLKRKGYRATTGNKVPPPCIPADLASETTNLGGTSVASSLRPGGHWCHCLTHHAIQSSHTFLVAECCTGTLVSRHLFLSPSVPYFVSTVLP